MSGCQRNLATLLQAIKPVEREAAAVLQQPDHTAHRVFVLVVANLARSRCGEQRSAKVAAQLLHPIDRRVQRRSPNKANQNTG